MITYVSPAVSLLQASEGLRQWRLSIEGRIKGAKMHSFYIVSHAESYFATPDEWRFYSHQPWVCRMALLRRLRGWTTFQRPAGRNQDGCVWHVALLAGEGCLSGPSGCQKWLPLIAPDRWRGHGHNYRASWFKSQMLTKKQNAPRPHIERLTFRMLNSYLGGQLPPRFQITLLDLSSLAALCDVNLRIGGDGMSKLEFFWMAVWPDSPLSVSAGNPLNH